MTEDTEEITDHWGRHYRSLEDLCRAYNVPVERAGCSFSLP